MKIVYEMVPQSDIESFAEKHDLTMVVTERDNKTLPRFFACFKGYDVMDGNLFKSVFGNGETELDAIKAYAHKLSRTTITNDSGKTTIIVPVLT